MSTAGPAPVPPRNTSRGQARTLNAIGDYRLALGDYHPALSHCRMAAAVHEQIGDITEQALTMDNLGQINHKIGDYHEAIWCYERAIELHREVGERRGEGECLNHLGDAHHAAGNPGTARDAWQRTVTILTQLDHVDVQQVRAKLDRIGHPHRRTRTPA
jgi:tetratricopeptide (TPR) repeat protein